MRVSGRRRPRGARGDGPPGLLSGIGLGQSGHYILPGHDRAGRRRDREQPPVSGSRPPSHPAMQKQVAAPCFWIAPAKSSGNAALWFRSTGPNWPSPRWAQIPPWRARRRSGITASGPKGKRMRFDPSMVEGPYLRDILAQPRALEDTVAGLCDAPWLADLAGFDRIVLTGMGASYHALHPLHIQLVEHGFHAVAYETSEL